ncbi:hypothetical protein [Embleya sp. NPDC005575]|uniref:hypothetical protein n=1 Tax=Embleya sp. NPDC005575 TaxID=3156892 RepID=UPI0033AED819
MTEVRDLEEAFTRHEHLAPTADGMIEAAYTGARRTRRRRRIAAGLGVAAVLAIGAAAPSGFALLTDNGPQQVTGPAAPMVKPPAVSIGVDGAEGLFVMERGFSGSTALATIRSDDLRPVGEARTVGGRDGIVGVYAPADVDVAALDAGEAITVQGHPARLVENYLIDPASNHTGPENASAVKKGTVDANGKLVPATPTDVRASVVAWRDATGSWVIVSGPRQRADLLRLAEAVRLEPTGTTTPYRLGFVPDTLRLDYGGSNTGDPNQANSVLVFGAAAQPVLKRSSLLSLSEQGALRIHVMAGDSGHLGMVERSGAPRVIAGHDTWYFTRPAAGLFMPEGGASMVAKVNGCEVLITVTDTNVVPYAALERMLASMTFGNCRAPNTWTAPLR